MQEIIQNALILTGESFWLFSVAAQLIKLHRTRDVRGLYPPTVVLNASGNIAWATYFVLNSLWFPFGANVAMLLLEIGVLYYLLFNRKTFLTGLLAIAAIGPLTAYVLFNFSFLSGWMGMVYNLIAATPWLIHVVTTKRVSGLSEHGLWLGVGAMICTFIYGVLIGSAPLITGCVQGILYSAVIVTYYYRYRKVAHKKTAPLPVRF